MASSEQTACSAGIKLSSVVLPASVCLTSYQFLQVGQHLPVSVMHALHFLCLVEDPNFDFLSVSSQNSFIHLLNKIFILYIWVLVEWPQSGADDFILKTSAHCVEKHTLDQCWVILELNVCFL